MNMPAARNRKPWQGLFKAGFRLKACCDLCSPASTGPRAVHHFSESKNGDELALDHKVSAQPRFQGNETRAKARAHGKTTIRTNKMDLFYG
jgi:hypothetical protein